jgi:hypothetical protein
MQYSPYHVSKWNVIIITTTTFYTLHTLNVPASARFAVLLLFSRIFFYCAVDAVAMLLLWIVKSSFL